MIKVKPGGRFNLTNVDENLRLVISEVHKKESINIYHAIKEQGIIKTFIHPNKTNPKWTIMIEDGKILQSHTIKSLMRLSLLVCNDFLGIYPKHLRATPRAIY